MGDSKFHLKLNYFRFVPLVTSLMRNQLSHTGGIRTVLLCAVDGVSHAENARTCMVVYTICGK